MVATEGLGGVFNCFSWPRINNDLRNVMYTFKDYPQNEWINTVYPLLQEALKKYSCGWPFYIEGDRALRQALRSATSASPMFRYQLYDTSMDGKADSNISSSQWIQVRTEHFTPISDRSQSHPHPQRTDHFHLTPHYQHTDHSQGL